MLDSAAVIVKLFGHAPLVALPFCMHLRDKAGGDAAKGTIDHPFTEHRTFEDLFDVEYRRAGDIVLRALGSEAGCIAQAKRQSECGQDDESHGHIYSSCKGVLISKPIATSFNMSGQTA